MIKKWYRVFLILISSAIAMLASIYLLAFIIEKPSIGKSQYLQLIDQNGHIFYQSNNRSNGIWVDLEDVNQSFLESIIAIEDKRFYEHKGIDFLSLTRAIKVNLFNQSKSQGASTITQQYARLLYLNNDKTWKRKINETFIALRMETHYTKEEILEGYVNSAYFGHGIYGIENASLFYFNKHAADLTYSESALLAGIVNGPAIYSPFIDLEKAYVRREVVLDALLEQGYISQENYSLYLKEEINLNHTLDQYDPTLNYFRDYVYIELQQLGFDVNQQLENGLKVYTTLDLNVQTLLSSTIQKEMPETELQVSSIVVKPYSSQILALAGGRDYHNSQFNRAIDSYRQVASTIKPLLYYLAIENGFQPNTMFLSAPTTFQLESGEIYSPKNFAESYAHQDISLAKAIAVSDNIYAVKTHLFLGEQTLTNCLKQFGFTNLSPHPSLALGTLSTNVFKLADIYNVFASEGSYEPLYAIERIEDGQGNVLYQHTPKQEQRFDRTSCLILNQLLTAPFENRYTSYSNATMSAFKPTRTFAGKSGTSEWDSWAIGYCPDILVAAWVGYDDHREMDDYDSRKVCKAIFYDVSEALTKDTEDHFYEPDKNITALKIDPDSGQVNSDGLTYWFRTQ